MPRRFARGREGAYTIPAAALELGESEKTVLRRIAGGRLRALRVRGRGGSAGRAGSSPPGPRGLPGAAQAGKRAANLFPLDD
jgi:hypothetical protein